MSRCRFLAAIPLVFISELASAQELLVNGSFESPEAVCGFPLDFGDWGVDAAFIVSAEAGITPRDGSQMLRLEFPFFNDNGLACLGVAGGASADVAQLIDVRHCHPAGNDATLRYLAHFNRSATGGASQYTCTLRAYAGVPADFSTTAPLVEASTVVPVGTSTAWLPCETELALPPTASFVAAYLSIGLAGGTREVYADAASVVPVQGRCGFDCTAPGATCPDPDSPASATLCETTSGRCVECLADDDCGDDGNECTSESCAGGTCTSSAAPAGTTCSTGVCSGSSCVQCVEDFDCGLGSTCDRATNTCVVINIDAGVEDAGFEDAGEGDAAREDAEVADAERADVVIADGGRSDGGARDASADASIRRDAAGGSDLGLNEAEDPGCGCHASRPGGSPSASWVVLSLALLARRRRRE